MSSNITNSAANKFALIYEFNNSSPLFARVAYGLIENNKIDNAIEILEKGLKIFPSYPTAYFVYAKALALTGNVESAKKMVKEGADLLDDENTKNYYLKLIAELSEKANEFTESKRVNFFDDDVDESTHGDSEVFEENLSDLADRLEGAKIELPPEENSVEETEAENRELNEEDQNSNNDEFDISSLNESLISPTLAEIFVAQGNLTAAKAIYNKLIETEPDKTDVFMAKISTIEELINKKNSLDESE